MRVALFPLALLVTTAACVAPDSQDLAAVRAVSMSGPALTWDELRIHPALQYRACAVSTLVNVDREVVGYCAGGRQCRTLDWRPVEDGCAPAGGVIAQPAREDDGDGDAVPRERPAEQELAKLQ